MLAIVVTEHNTTSALQIVLEHVHDCSSMSAATRGRSYLLRSHPLNVFAFKLDNLGDWSGRLAAQNWPKRLSCAMHLRLPRFMTSLHGAYSELASLELAALGRAELYGIRWGSPRLRTSELEQIQSRPYREIVRAQPD